MELNEAWGEITGEGGGGENSVSNFLAFLDKGHKIGKPVCTR